MYIPVFLNSFKKDYKRIEKRGWDKTYMDIVLKELVNDKKLSIKYKDHKLKGIFKDCRECHIFPDWLLIYKIEEKENKIIFIRTGSHSDLFE
jgi:mRNA interferase YafQ